MPSRDSYRKDIEAALERLKRFHDQLNTVQRFRGTNAYQAELETQKLATLFGELEPDLAALNVPRRARFGGSEYPVFETIIRRSESDTVQDSCLREAIQAVGKAIGRTQRFIADGHDSFPRPSAEATTHRVSHKQRLWAAVIAGATAAVFSGLFVNIVTNAGWSGMLSHPFQSATLVILAIGFGVAAAIIGTR